MSALLLEVGAKYWPQLSIIFVLAMGFLWWGIDRYSAGKNAAKAKEAALKEAARRASNEKSDALSNKYSHLLNK